MDKATTTGKELVLINRKERKKNNDKIFLSLFLTKLWNNYHKM